MRRRLGIAIRGAVQGVGFRPFVFLLAEELALQGWVNNDSAGVHLEVEGEPDALSRFVERLRAEKPALAIIDRLETAWLEPAGFTTFEIRESDAGGAKTASVLPDLAMCPACRAELDDARSRHFGYPFTNCTRCGPRFSILRALPYDRPNTAMAGFEMCPACRAEYENPRDRRFHAQPTACARCGPAIALWAPPFIPSEVEGRPRATPVARDAAALDETARALREGKIAAIKGLGGFQLMVDARNGAAVRTLRERKARWGKPFALMVRDLEAAREICEVPEEAAALLQSPQAPIVLLRRLSPALASEIAPVPTTPLRSAVLAPEIAHDSADLGVMPPTTPQRSADLAPEIAPDSAHLGVLPPTTAALAPEIAPDSADLGVMLPTTPLHHLLFARVDFPLVATSGNVSDEPICTDENDALARLGGIADLFLVHDRPIERHVDDSVAFLFRGTPRLLRRARGYSPLPIAVHRELPPVLAVGAQLKNVVALATGRTVFLSQHIGDLETPAALDAFERVISDFLRLYAVEPEAIAHDLHPDLASTRWAQAHARAPLVAVQHHHAHFASCLAENGREGPALGVTWDGTGLGTDGTIWGGEFLLGGFASVERVATLRSFRLPGGDAAVRAPWRTAAALLFESGAPVAVRAAPEAELRLVSKMLERKVNAPLTSSAGRLFDAVSALVGLCPVASYEGQAAMALEHAADPFETGAYPLPLVPGSPATLDWGPLLDALLEDLRKNVPAATVAARFHNALADGIAAVARQVHEPTVALSGGCFQNRLLTARVADRLEREGFEVLLHRQVPANDGGLSLGQAMVAAARL